MMTIRTLPLLFALAVPVMATGAQAGAQAAELRMTVEPPHFTCEGRGALLTHAAYVPGEARRSAGEAIDQAAPLPCCDGQIGCAQFLSTNTILRPARKLRG